MRECVIDTSVIMACLYSEPGGDMLPLEHGQGYVTAINWVEVLSKLYQQAVDQQDIRHLATDLGLAIVPFEPVHCDYAARLHARHKSRGLSYADCACLGYGHSNNLPVYTADQLWAGLDRDTSVHLIR